MTAGLLALALALPAAAAERSFHILAFRSVDHAVSDPLAEAWDSFLKSEGLAVESVEAVKTRSDGERYAVESGGVALGRAEALETYGGFLLLSPADPALLARFESFLARPDRSGLRRAPRAGRRSVRVSEGEEGEGFLMTLEDSVVPRAPSWSECVAARYRLPGGRGAYLVHRTRGGLGRAAAAAERLRERWGRDVVVLSRGDAFEHRSAEGAQIAAALGRAGVRAVVPGLAEMTRFSEFLTAPVPGAPVVLAANMKAAPGAVPVAGRAVFPAGGLRVGLFGLTAESNARALPAEDARRYAISDPLEAARSAAAALRREADVVVALTNLTPAQNARLRQRVPGIDVVIGDTLPEDPEAEPATVTAEDPERGPGDAALLVTSDAPAEAVHLTLRRDDSGAGRYSLAAREERIPLDDSLPDLPGYARFHYEAFGVAPAGEAPVLPATRRLYGTEGPVRLKDLDFWRMSAVLVAGAADAEAAFVPVQPVEERTSGEHSEGVVRSWFATPDRVAVVVLPGSALASLYAEARRTEDPDASLPPGGIRLAAGGFGPGGTVHGVPVDPRSAYRVALTERVLAQADQFPALRGVAPEPGGAPLDDAVVAALRAASAGGAPPERLRALFSGAPPREEGLWQVDFREIGLTVSNTKVVTDPSLASVSNARVRGFDELLIGGESRVDGEYQSRALKWTNTVELEYARSRLRPPGQPDVLSTPKNRLDGRTSAALKLVGFPVSWVATAAGPSFGVEYEGEVERLPLTRRKHKVSVLPGVELFNGSLVRSLSVSANLQRDFTPPAPVNQYGARLRALMGAPLGPARVSGEFGVRYFFLRPQDTAQDLRLEMDVLVKLSMPLYKRFTLSPYFDFLYVQHKVTTATGYSAITGVTLGFSRLWKPRFEPL